MSKIWYLYFDGERERDELLFAMPSKKLAEAAAKKMNEFAKRAKAKLPKEPEYPFNRDFENRERRNKWIDEYEKAVAKIRWPYGINMLRQDCVYVGSMPLKGKPC